MGRRVSVDKMAAEIMEQLEKYADATSEATEQAVRDAANTVRREIRQNAPVHTGGYKGKKQSRKPGTYKGAWRTWIDKPRYGQTEAIIYSGKPSLPHLLEYGHALRNGGRATAHEHIAPAAEIGEEQLIKDIEEALRG